MLARRMILSLLVLAIAGTCMAQKLYNNTPVTVQLTKKVSSAVYRSAQLAVAYDVVVDGKVVIRAGAPVLCTTRCYKASGCGRPGSVALEITGTQMVDGQNVYLSGSELVEGKSKKGLSIGLGVGVGLVAWPGLFCLCIKGQNAVIPEGTQFVANVVGDYTLKEE